jgi:hypothetical protein
MSMNPVFIEPAVGSSGELHIFCCFACGEVRCIAQKTTPHNQAAKTRRVSLIEAASVGRVVFGFAFWLPCLLN